MLQASRVGYGLTTFERCREDAASTTKPIGAIAGGDSWLGISS